jgi:hypothetical protein
MAVLEAVVNIAKTANAPVEAWEAAATLLRQAAGNQANWHGTGVGCV